MKKGNFAKQMGKQAKFAFEIISKLLRRIDLRTSENPIEWAFSGVFCVPGRGL